MTRRSELPGGFGTASAFNYASVRDAGASDGRTRAADLEAPFFGVRVPAGSPTDLRSLCGAYAVRMPPGGFFSHQTAAALHGLPLPFRVTDDALLHVSVKHPVRARRMAGIVGHTVKTGIPIVRMMGTLPVLSPAQAWCQLGAVLDVEEMIEAGDRLLGRPHPLCTALDIERSVRAVGGRRGHAHVRAAYPQLRARVESPRETRLRRAVVAAGLPEPEVNVWILDRQGRPIALGDLVYPEYKVLLEYDGEQHRQLDAQYARDVQRLNDIAAEDWRHIRQNKHMSLAEAVERTRQALLDRGWRP
ncbi:hypothetical protein [Microterricola viridarii]|uniref:DUF559 domain-containing protein n=1 Tax=Microterricola viridarii TaxID=412690 RepID=A0A1H1QS70_9MICO|nr:hypothetical protein [Microterricola viridarii]SDS26342.1 hypothetical protein SAMN04489834_1161 [Microterricola viridarii]